MPPFLLALFTTKTGLISTLSVLLLLSAGGYYLYTNHEIKTLKANNEIIQLELEKQVELVKHMEADIKQITIERKEYSDKVTDLDNKRLELEKKLNDKTSSLSDDIKKKSSKVVEQRINSSVNSILECFKTLTNNTVLTSKTDCRISDLNP